MTLNATLFFDCKNSCYSMLEYFRGFQLPHLIKLQFLFPRN
jgi:hypothetical protein